MQRSLLVILVAAGAACGGPDDAPETFYDREIGTIFEFGCASQTAGCHTATPEGTAAGNLDLSTYDSLMRRRDVLPPYGPYPVGLLLLKAGDPVEVSVDTLDGPVTVVTDIRHNAGSGIELGALSYARLKRWIDDGYSRHGAPDDRTTQNEGGCVPGAGTDAQFDPEAPPADAASFERFVSDVQPVLRERCAGSACHGAALADLHLACGDDEAERRWNYWIAVQHLADPAERSELLRRPLAAGRGGAFHGGGDTFATEDDAGYRAILAWAEDLVARAPETVAEDASDPGYAFFVNRVQPVLVRKGCMALNCHSPISLKLNLRGGSQGSFSRFARRRNYALARKLLAPESPSPNESRIVAKNLFPPELTEGGEGIAHRGGSLFEDFGVANPATPDDCDGVDADGGDLNEVPAYCVLARWHEIERAEAIARGEILPDDEPVRGVLWVARPPGVGDPTDFDTYRPGADLRIADATFDADGGIEFGPSRSLLEACGIDPATADVRGPAGSWDASRIAFAVRTAADRPLRLWEVRPDGSGCAPIDGVAAPVDSENGILTHDFDPAYAPDGRLVFASTRGNLDREAYDYQGPTRTPAQMQPNANLYAFDPDAGEPYQLTFLLDQEMQPAFMMDGRVIYTAEKRAEGFHHLALRRQMLDGGDYHPLYAQRPSLGFGSATEVVQLPDLNFAFVAGHLGLPDGAGTIAVFNRSIGPDQQDRPEEERGYVHSMRVPAPGLLGGLSGVYRSPAALPSGRILASCDTDAMVMASGFDFDLCELDPHTGGVREVGGEPGVAEVEVAVLYARPNRGVLVSNGEGIDLPAIVPGRRDAIVHFNDFPMIASLMFENTREGRPLDHRIGGFEVVEVLPPPVGVETFDDLADGVVEDDLGPMYLSTRVVGHVPLFADGSTIFRVRGGMPFRFRLTDGDGDPLLFPEDAPFEGVMIQREQEQYFPGERIQRSIPRRFFNAVCGGCHGSITGRELDIAVDLDVISGASQNLARDATPHDLYD